MDKKKHSRLLLGVSVGCALGMFATAALADPYTLQGVCRVTSTITGQGTCQLEFLLSDSNTSTDIVTQSLITVDGTAVSRYMNDNVTPGMFSAGTVSGQAAVSCGTAHVVRAYVHKSTSPGTEERVGSLPAVICPSAP